MILSVSTFGFILDLNRIDVQEFEMYFFLPVKAQVMLVLSTRPGASSQGCRASGTGPAVPVQGRARAGPVGPGQHAGPGLQAFCYLAALSRCLSAALQAAGPFGFGGAAGLRQHMALLGVLDGTLCPGF